MFQEHLRHDLQRQVDLGTMVLDPKTDSFRLTLKGALRGTYKQLPPFSGIMKRTQAQEAATLVRTGP